MSSKAAQARYDALALEKLNNANFCDTQQVYEYIRNELCRYIPASRLEDRIADRITECKAKGHNPLEWVYCEVYEEINFKKAVYFRWEKLV